MTDQRRATDEELIGFARGDSKATQDLVQSIAGELIAARRILRGDSRTAEQVRRLRYVLEAIPKRLEELAGQIKAKDAEESKKW